MLINNKFHVTNRNTYNYIFRYYVVVLKTSFQMWSVVMSAIITISNKRCLLHLFENVTYDRLHALKELKLVNLNNRIYAPIN